MSTSVGPEPCIVVCPSCRQQVTTRVEPKATTKTHLIALIMCLTFLWPCLLPVLHSMRPELRPPLSILQRLHWHLRALSNFRRKLFFFFFVVDCSQQPCRNAAPITYPHLIYF
uniref:IP16855p n=1 Tax=Drosophila melanogaster TaxID=7227 RepID=A4VCK9_DROME|nr:IP16855p [Drosophila melanogaster]